MPWNNPRMPVNYELSGHIATLTIDRPKALNSIDLETFQALSDSVQRLEDDAEAWVGIVTGAGDRSFSAGADLRETIPRMLRDPKNDPFHAPPTLFRGQTVTKPLIAAVNGMALGGGLEIALACDIRLAADTARFGAPEVGLGIIPGWGATQRLPRHIGWSDAAKMIFSGEPIDAAEALRIGLVSAVHPAEELLGEATKLAETLCTRGPLALQAAKRAMLEGASLPLIEGLAVEQREFDGLAYTEDLKEGLDAFTSKRPPNFHGR